MSADLDIDTADPAANEAGGGPGRTTIADRVVERIAARAVAEVDSATGVARQVLGVRLGTTGPDTSARVSAFISGGLVSVEVRMAVAWPASVRNVTEQVRQHVTAQVGGLTGLRVAEVDIEVPEILTETTRPARVH